MTTVTKIDEYLKKSNYNILIALANVFNSNRQEAYNLLDKLNIEQETHLVNILDDVFTTYKEKKQNVIKFFKDINLLEDISWFNDVYIDKDYSYMCIINDVLMRDKYMDWLDKNSYEYLVNTDGNFAIKCINRDRIYRASHAADACNASEWLKLSTKQNVEPKRSKLRLSSPKEVPLTDSASLEYSNFNTFKDKSGSPSPFTYDTVDDDDIFDEGKKLSIQHEKKMSQKSDIINKNKTYEDYVTRIKVLSGVLSNTLINESMDIIDSSNKMQISNATHQAKELFIKEFDGKLTDVTGKIFSFKKNKYAYIAYDGMNILAIKVNSNNSTNIKKFNGSQAISIIMTQILK